MPGRQSEDWGISLWDAIERWTPRELWERYRALAEYDLPMIILGGRDDPCSHEARRLRSRISEILVDRLVRGELIASGIAMPLKETSRRRDIRSELWPLLTFGYRFLAVSGTGLKYGQLLIREAPTAAHGAPEREARGAPAGSACAPRAVSPRSAFGHGGDRGRDASPSGKRGARTVPESRGEGIGRLGCGR